MLCYTVYKTLRTSFLILSCTPFRPQNSLNSSGHGLYKVSKAFHRDAGSCWCQCFPQLCQVGWMSFGGWTTLDTRKESLSMKNPATDYEKQDPLVWWNQDWNFWPECQASCTEETCQHPYGETWWWKHHAVGMFFSSRDWETSQDWGKDEWSKGQRDPWWNPAPEHSGS